MATLDDVRKIASVLPGAFESDDPDRFGFSVLVMGKYKGFLWSWMERIDPKKPKVINRDVLAMIVPSLLAKDVILESNPRVYFTEDHYNGFPAVLVKVSEIDVDELHDLVVQAWRTKASPDLVKQYDASGH